MIRVILADHQALFRSGMVRVLSIEDEFRVAAQCGDWAHLLSAVRAFPKALIIVSSTFKAELETLVKRAGEVGSRVLVIIEDTDSFHAYLFMGAAGAAYRSVTTASFLDSVRAVIRGGKFVPPGSATPEEDQVGTRARAQLTPKEITIVALLVEGMTNRHIAERLNTSEQVVKNKLRKIFDKTGVSDRLELALFTLHHRILASAAAEANAELQFQAATHIPIAEGVEKAERDPEPQ